MAKRTLDNCSLIKKIGIKPEQYDSKCMGYGVSEMDDEPCEKCKKCTLNTGYEEDVE